MGFGLVYGFVHEEGLRSKGSKEIDEYNYQQKQALVADAKREWNIQHPPAVKTDKSGATVDLDNSNTDWAQVVDDALNALDPVKA